jgi:hypothetical protein
MEKLNQKKHGSCIRNLNTHVVMLGFVLLFGSCSNDDVAVEPWEEEIAQLKASVEPLKDFEAAKAAGWEIQATEYRMGMGYHFLNAGLLDEKFEPAKPEVLLFINDPTGNMELVAVEYGIPIADLDNPGPPPEGFAGSGDIWKIDTEFSLWTLHAWVVMENPEGIFAPMNPLLP